MSRSNGQRDVRKNANEVHKVKCFRNGVNLFGKAILRKCTFKVEVFCRSSLGCLSVFSRWNKARYKRRKRNGNLNKTHFFSLGVLFFILCAALFLRVGTLRAQHSKCHPRHFFILRSSLVHPWFILGLLYEGDRQGTAGRNLNKHTLILRESVLNSAFIVRVLCVNSASIVRN